MTESYGQRIVKLLDGANIRNLLYLLLIGLGISLIPFIILFLFSPSDISIEFQLFFNLAALFFNLLTSFSLGIIIAILVSTPLISFIDKKRTKVKEALDIFANANKWPGREFLSLLSQNLHGDSRVEFKSLGLDINLRIPDPSTANYIERLSTVLYTIQREAENIDPIECNGDEKDDKKSSPEELCKTAKNARDLLRKLNNSERIRKVCQLFFYSAFPFIIAPFAAYLFDYCILEIPYPTKSVGKLATYYSILSIILFCAVPAVTYIFSQIFHMLTWNISKLTSTELDDILFLAISWFIGGLLGIAILCFSFYYSKKIPDSMVQLIITLKYLLIPFKITEVSGFSFIKNLSGIKLFLLRAAIVMLITSTIILLVTSLCKRVFRKMVAKTDDKFDDMVVELARIFGTFVIGAVGFGWILLFLFYDVADRILENGALMPYVILISVVGAVMGIASRDLLENFFSGLSLQIDKPFLKGEKILLESGELCEFRQIGTRSTQFYSISDNSESYVPNSKLAKQTLKNLSKPDRESRRCIKFYIPNNGYATEDQGVILAEGILLLAAFVIDDVDAPIIAESDIKNRYHLENRKSILDELTNIKKYNEQVLNDSITTPINLNCITILEEKEKLLRCKDLLWNNNHGTPLGNISRVILIELAESARLISYKYQELERICYNIIASHSAIMGDFEHFTSELRRAPVVRSRLIPGDETNGIWELELCIFAYSSEQSEVVLHYLNILTNQLFKLAGIYK